MKETKYEYDDHSNVILATSKDIHSDSVAGILVSTSEITYNYEYDENGNKLKSVQRTTYDHSQDYNELTQEYDETGKPIRGQYIFYSYTGDDGSLLETPKESVSNFTISYDGDQYTRTFTADDGAVFNTEEGFYANGELYATKFKAGESEGTYEYDEYNNRISATETSGDTTRTSTAEHEYEFDENWNIIAMTTTPSEENSQITRTEYTYQLIQ